MDNEIFEMVTQSLTEDRISRIMNCDEEYQVAKLHERVAHDKLMEILADQQKELLDDFITAASETEVNAARIIYQQGMKDLYALIMALA